MTQLDLPKNKRSCFTGAEPRRPDRARDEAQGTEFRSLLAAARGGDGVALDDLFTRFYPRVQRMVHHSLATDLRSNRTWLTARFSTGDVVQEVFRSVLQDMEGFEGKDERAFAGYLAMIVRNRILDAVRFHEAARRDGRRTSVPVEDTPLAGGEIDPAEALSRAEELHRFHEALAAVPGREQLLLRARFEQTTSFQDLADQLGYSSASAARRAYYAAQARLAIQLKDG